MGEPVTDGMLIDLTVSTADHNTAVEPLLHIPKGYSATPIQSRLESGLLTTVAEKRDKLIALKTAEIKATEAIHDDLVRELFHLEKYKLMTLYDRKEARKDISVSYQRYKEDNYPLIDVSIGSSRQKRRIPFSSNLSPGTDTVPAYARVEPVRARKTHVYPSTPPTSRKKEAETASLLSSPSSLTRSPAASVRASTLNRRRPTSATFSSSDGVVEPPRKRRRTESEQLLDRDNFHTHPLSTSPPPTPNKPNRISTRRTRDLNSSNELLNYSSQRPVLTNKKVELSVHDAIANISHPDQRTDPPLFHYSLPKLLESYRSLNDQDLDGDEWHASVQKDAATLNDAQILRIEDRLPPGTGILFGGDDDVVGSLEDGTPGRDSRDVWDTILDEAAEEWRLRQKAIRNGGREQFFSKLVAQKLLAEWGAQEAKRIKEQAQEERKVKSLAKHTANLVHDEWKRVVFHIRERDRQEEEAEELRQGQLHLGDILEQSAIILETQKGDLAATESSYSRSVSFGDVSVSDSDDDEDINTDGDEDEPEDEDEPDDEDDDEGDGRHHSLRFVPSSPSTPHSMTSEPPCSPLLELAGIPPDNVRIADGDSEELSRIMTPGLPKTMSIDIVEPNTSMENGRSPHPESTTVPKESPSPSNTEPSGELILLEHLQPYGAVPVHWDSRARIHPILLRGTLRPYQQTGLEWLASLHTRNMNGILADEMGLGKTIQTIALLAHLACDRGIWGPHLIVVPTSVLLNWEMEFKKFLPGFKVISYHGTIPRRRELRKGWSDPHSFNICITSYTLASRDAQTLKRKAWYYMILDEAHMIKNFKSQRWQTLLMFRSFRRLLLTGTPLQNNLTELWALLQFLMSGSNFANLKEFGSWFSNPLERAIEMGHVENDETQQQAQKLHSVLRPYILRRLKKDVEKELPQKFEHLVLCPLSKRQRFLYDEFMSRRETHNDLESGQYQKIANILMQLRKVCNHPDLFEVRPIVTSFAMPRSAVADFEIEELLVRRRLLQGDPLEQVNLDLFGFQFINRVNTPYLRHHSARHLDATHLLPHARDQLPVLVPKNTRKVKEFRAWRDYQDRVTAIRHSQHMAYLNRFRCQHQHVSLSAETVQVMSKFTSPLLPASQVDWRHGFLDKNRTTHLMVQSLEQRSDAMAPIIDRFAFVTPPVLAPRDFLHGIHHTPQARTLFAPSLSLSEEVFHRASVKLQIAFPEPSLLQYDCGKLQELAVLLREKKRGGHRVLIFTQMTRILDILEIFLNFHGYLYMRLDGSTKIEDRQYITERFNADAKIFAFIASSRSGGVGINLTGADTVVFYDSDFNPQMDRQCEDRAHRIGQMRDVHIYRFVSEHTVEEAMLRKANQKRTLDDLVIQKGRFDWSSLFGSGDEGTAAPLQATLDEGALAQALGQFEDREDQEAAQQAAAEEGNMAKDDAADFQFEDGGVGPDPEVVHDITLREEEQDAEPYIWGQGGYIVQYMLDYVERESEEDFFAGWRI